MMPTFPGLAQKRPSSDAAVRPPVDLCAENGEFHTCVVAGPMFDAAPTHARERLAAARAGAIVDRDGFVFGDVVLPDAADVVFPDAQVRQASE